MARFNYNQEFSQQEALEKLAQMTTEVEAKQKELNDSIVKAKSFADEYGLPFVFNVVDLYANNSQDDDYYDSWSSSSMNC